MRNAVKLPSSRNGDYLAAVQLHGFGQPGQLFRKFARRREETAQPDKCSHDLHVHSDRARRLANAGEHRHALIRESGGMPASVHPNRLRS